MAALRQARMADAGIDWTPIKVKKKEPVIALPEIMEPKTSGQFLDNYVNL